MDGKQVKNTLQQSERTTVDAGGGGGETAEIINRVKYLENDTAESHRYRWV